MLYLYRRCVKQFAACRDDSLEEVGLLAADEASPDPTQVGPEPAEVPQPDLVQAEIHSEQLVRARGSRLQPVIHLRQQTLGPVAQPGGPVGRISQDCPTADGRILSGTERACQIPKPVAIDIHIVIEKRDDIVPGLRRSSVASMTQPLTRFADVSQPSGKGGGDVQDDLRGVVRTIIVDNDYFVFPHLRRIDEG
jgi:hypothetical protein